MWKNKNVVDSRRADDIIFILKDILNTTSAYKGGSMFDFIF